MGIFNSVAELCSHCLCNIIRCRLISTTLDLVGQLIDRDRLLCPLVFVNEVVDLNVLGGTRVVNVLCECIKLSWHIFIILS